MRLFEAMYQVKGQTNIMRYETTVFLSFIYVIRLTFKFVGDRNSVNQLREGWEFDQSGTRGWKFDQTGNITLELSFNQIFSCRKFSQSGDFTIQFWSNVVSSGWKFS